TVSSPTSFFRASKRNKKDIPAFLKEVPETSFDTIVAMENVNIRYGDKVVLKDISWTVKLGEKCLFQGPNGSGKSTLLSLINADHHQAYGPNLQLVGQTRGAGESIWAIKQKIGMLSPEMHGYFDTNATVCHTIASRFCDRNGWFIDGKIHE